MKIIKRKRQPQNIYGMALSRGDAIKKLQAHREVLAEHIVCCVAYGRECRGYAGWLQEITAMLKEAGDISVKREGKFTEEVYKEEVFGWLGDSWADAERGLRDLQEKVNSGEMEREHGYKYEEFEITNRMTTDLHSIMQSIQQQMAGYFSELKKYEPADERYIKKMVDNIFRSVLG